MICSSLRVSKLTDAQPSFLSPFQQALAAIATDSSPAWHEEHLAMTFGLQSQSELRSCCDRSTYFAAHLHRRSSACSGGAKHVKISSSNYWRDLKAIENIKSSEMFRRTSRAVQALSSWCWAVQALDSEGKFDEVQRTWSLPTGTPR